MLPFLGITRFLVRGADFQLACFVEGLYSRDRRGEKTNKPPTLRIRVFFFPFFFFLCGAKVDGKDDTIAVSLALA